MALVKLEDGLWIDGSDIETMGVSADPQNVASWCVHVRRYSATQSIVLRARFESRENATAHLDTLAQRIAEALTQSKPKKRKTTAPKASKTTPKTSGGRTSRSRNSSLEETNRKRREDRSIRDSADSLAKSGRDAYRSAATAVAGAVASVAMSD